MNDILELRNPKKDVGLSLDKTLDLDIKRNNVDFTKIVGDVIRSGIIYNIKSLGKENGDLSSVLKSVKEMLNKTDYKNMIGSAVEASVVQGLENGKQKKSSLKDLNNFKNISLNGGLKFMVSAGIDILLNKLLKGNILSPIIKKAISSIKNFLSSSSFIDKIQNGIEKLQNRIGKFKQTCKDWYNAYEEFDIKKINEVAKSLNKQKGNVLNNTECTRENDIIQNMTKLINNKKDKLSDMQLQICSNL